MIAKSPWKQAVRAKTSSALPANSYSNGADGVGATLTGNTNGTIPAIDGVALAVSDRLLVASEATAARNGIYVVTELGDASNPYVLTRAADADRPFTMVSATTKVSEGDTYADQEWQCTTDAPIVVGTTALIWEQVGGGVPEAPTNGTAYVRKNGAWVAESGGGGASYERARTVPVSSDFTLENPGAGGTLATMADGTFGLILTVPTASVNIRFLRLTSGPPATPWTITLRGGLLTPYSTVVHRRCIILRNSSNARLLTLADVVGAGITVNRWSSYTAFASTVVNLSVANGVEVPWRRVTNDGTTLSFQISPNGQDWFTIATELLSNYISAVDQVGMGIALGSAPGVTMADIFQSWEIA